MSKAKRERAADWLMVLAAPILFGSLFLAWSHQFPAALRARYAGTTAFAGVPRDPDAWQVYSVADVLLALLGVGLLVVALRGGRAGRRALALGLAMALAFTLHALSAPPTNGLNLFDPALSPPAYTSTAEAAGPGETLALVAYALGLGGLLLSFTAD